MEFWVAILIALAIPLLVLFAGRRAFRRNFWVAVLCLIFLPPIWLIWAVIKLWKGAPPKTNSDVGKDASNSKKRKDKASNKRRQAPRESSVTKSSIFAAGLATGSATRSVKPARVVRPVVKARRNSDRIDRLEHLGGKKWRIHVTYWHNDAVGYTKGRNDITPAMSGFNTGTSGFNVRWVK